MQIFTWLMSFFTEKEICIYGYEWRDIEGTWLLFELEANKLVGHVTLERGFLWVGILNRYYKNLPNSKSNVCEFSCSEISLVTAKNKIMNYLTHSKGNSDAAYTLKKMAEKYNKSLASGKCDRNRKDIKCQN